MTIEGKARDGRRSTSKARGMGWKGGNGRRGLAPLHFGGRGERKVEGSVCPDPPQT